MRFFSIPFVCLSLVLLGTGCPAPTSPPDNVQTAKVAFGAPVDFDHVTQSVEFEDGLTVTLEEVRDSRCPADVVCIWAGEVSFDFVLSGGDLEAITPLTLSTTNTPSASVPPYAVSAALSDAEAASPAPMPTVTVTRSDASSGAVTDFESCAAAGNPVMESYPRQCRAGNTTFTEEFELPVGSGEPGSSEPGSPGTGGVLLFDRTTIQIGDQVGSMTLIKVDAHGLQFSGTVEVTGQYLTYSVDDPFLSGRICFENLDEGSLTRMPYEVTDSRDVWFCFTNEDFARTAFQNDAGKATVTISDYYINLMESEVWNTATLQEVIQKSSGTSGLSETGQSEPDSPGDGGTVTSPPDSGYPYEGSGFELDKTACEAAGGTFNECGSACRGAAPNTPCIMMCVMYCECASSSQCPNDMTCGDFVDGTGVCKSK